MKRGIDVVASLVLLVVLAPVLALTALVVRLDSSGPVLFRQRRYGHGLAPFTILKFRTMYADASPELHRLHFAWLAADAATVPGTLKKVIDDPRLTRSGGILRKWSLDELPQLVNVLRGEMSLVGPRPAIGYELDHYKPGDFERFEVRPGMTGLWQVSGRSELGVREMLELDRRYVRDWSLTLDLRILARTPRAAIRGSA
jgi:lipopolysaccharide/colanic/teichoic acid biosynthesis glycosyltransferase